MRPEWLDRRPWSRVASLVVGLLCVLVCHVGSPARGAAEAYSRADLEAVMIDKIIDFVTWPRAALEGRATFDVVVLGETGVYPRLSVLLGRRLIHGLRARVLQARSPEAIGQPHVLFIAADHAPNVGRVLVQLGSGPVLTVGATHGLVEQGIAVNLVQHGRRMHFEVGRGALARAGLRASYQLLSLARVAGGLEPW